MVDEKRIGELSDRILQEFHAEKILK
jgi:hypothetical protein